MKYFSAIFSTFLVLVLFSCSEDATNPTVEKNYLPYNIGNYWIYEVKELDGGSNPINDIGTDSIIVAGNITINEKSGVELHVYRNNVLYDTLYLSVEGESLYQHRDETTDDIPGFNEWLELINFTAEQWFMYRFSSEYYKYEFADTTFSVNAQFVYNGYFHGPKKVLIPSTVIEYETLHFSNKLDTKIDFEYIEDSVKTDFNIIQSINMDYYMSDGIGMVLQTFRPSIQYINSEPFYYNGWQRQLIRHYVISPETN